MLCFILQLNLNLILYYFWWGKIFFMHKCIELNKKALVIFLAKAYCGVSGFTLRLSHYDQSFKHAGFFTMLQFSKWYFGNYGNQTRDLPYGSECALATVPGRSSMIYGPCLSWQMTYQVICQKLAFLFPTLSIQLINGFPNQ